MAEAGAGPERKIRAVARKKRPGFTHFVLRVKVRRHIPAGLAGYTRISMSDWQKVQDLFLDVVDLPVRERNLYLQKACKDDPELYAEIDSLLAADRDSEALLHAVVQIEADRFFDTAVLVGERLGIYRIVREIGQGGMGCVYLAVRDDEEFHKEVALKIVKRGMDTKEVLKRFRYERQILANLEHPYIARLFDGGSTEDGVPFFVMEYVEGQPLDVYCREKSLDIDARCGLFVRILEAVAYAHRNLVVHRDLKPANILVTADGTPKLLDFGVAKLLSGDSEGNRTITTVFRPITPGYASPEQVRGLPITTATDIYSLGAILYEILSGEQAQKITANTPSEIDRIVCDTEVARPSLHRREISADLDNIVLMAMRKEPERRYPSADQFAQDVRSCLQGRPVMARQDSLTYRAAKFVRRNFLPLAMATLVAMLLIAGLAVSLTQTRRAQAARRLAESQRKIAESQQIIAQHQTALAEASSRAESHQKLLADQQRDEAQRQKALAEQRVNDIFELASKTFFDIDDAIAPLPGSIAVRRTLLKSTLEYLQNLEHQAGLDDQMREALCAAYYKVAQIEGSPQSASLQDFDAAEKNLLKGQKLLMPAYRRKPNDPGLMLRLIEVRSSLAELMSHTGRRNQAIQIYTDLLPVAERLARVEPCTLNCKTQIAVMENSLAIQLLTVDPARALGHVNRGISLMQALADRHPDDTTLKQGLGTLTAAGAGAYRQMGELEKSAKYFRDSIQAREQLLQLDADNPALRRNLMTVYGNYATLLGIPWSPNLGKPAEARIYAGKAVAIARATVASDLNNATARHDLGMSLSRLGMIDPAPDGVHESLASLEESRKLIEPTASPNVKSVEIANQVALILEYEGLRYQALGQTEEAAASFRRSMELLQPFFDQQNAAAITQYCSSEEDLALLYASTGNPAALALANDVMAQAEKHANLLTQPDSKTALLGEAWSTLAVAQSKAGQTDQASQSAVTALKLWNSFEKPGLLSAHRRAMANVQALVKIPQ